MPSCRHLSRMWLTTRPFESDGSGVAMKTLITGGAGFIGSTVASACQDAGVSPVVLDDLSKGRSEYVADRLFYEGDIAGGSLVDKVFTEHPDVSSRWAGILNVVSAVPQPDFVQPRQRFDGSITLAEPDAAWAEEYARQEARIRAALGPRVLQVEHVGSTSVPGLAAKPILDILLVVERPADEDGYVLALEPAGYVLHLREPGWYQHRLLRRGTPDVNLHVFGSECPEVERMLLFRDRLRSRAEERALYQETKRELAASRWAYVQDYADAKSAVVEAILTRARTDPPS